VFAEDLMIPSLPYVERRHANGVFARVLGVSYLGFEAYQAMSHRRDPAGNLVTAVVNAGFQTMEQAQLEADELAHPGCTDTGCGRWSTPDPEVDASGAAGDGEDERRGSILPADQSRV
jgi:hypothetical protein